MSIQPENALKPLTQYRHRGEGLKNRICKNDRLTISRFWLCRTVIFIPASDRYLFSHWYRDRLRSSVRTETDAPQTSETAPEDIGTGH